MGNDSFENLLEKTFRLTEKKSYRFLYTIDADTILHPLGIKKLEEIALKMPENFFSAQGKVLDKFFGVFRPAGQRVYNAKLATKAISFIPQIAGEIRPEASLIKKMERVGNRYFLSNDIIGVHDYEQFYGDLYRKSYIHSRKHRNEMLRRIPKFLKLMRKDNDFRVIMRGIKDGLSSTKQIKIDKRIFEHDSQRALSELGLKEKKLLDLELEYESVISALYLTMNSAEKNKRKKS